MAEKRYRVSVEFGDELGARVEEAASAKYLKLSDFVRMAVAEYLKSIKDDDK